MREYGLSLKQVADAVRRENVEVPGGTMRTESQEFLLRGKNKRLRGDEIAKIPVLTQPGGVVLTVGELGRVSDQFADVTAESWVNGRPAIVLAVDKTSKEDLLQIVSEVREYIETHPLPEGYDIETWRDTSILVRQRLELLTENGLYGLLLVFFILTLFLEFRLAFWVAMGIPLSMLGACAILYFTGQTMNMLSMFAFIMALGILVDDAIVIGENVFTHRGMGKGRVQAAIDGTTEVLPSVLASVTTTIFAFLPFLFVPGIMGKFIAVMPAAMITMLLLSLFESTFILPCHLSHEVEKDGRESLYRQCRRRLPAPFGPVLAILIVCIVYPLQFFAYPFKRFIDLLHYINDHVTDGLHWTIERVYMPLLRGSLRYPALTMSIALASLLVAFGIYKSGIIPFIAIEKDDSLQIAATIRYPDGTPASVTAKATERLEAAIRGIDEAYRKRTGKPLVKLIHRGVGGVNVIGGYDPGEGIGGSSVGGVLVELVDSEERDVESTEVVPQWREAAGEFSGTEGDPLFKVESGGPGGTPIEFVALADPEHMDELEAFTEECKAYLAGKKGVFDIRDDSFAGKWEFQITVKDRAKAMGIPLAELAQTVRGSYYGEEAMRLQRGRHEVKLMVRYPEDERRSTGNFDDIRVRAGGYERPLTELADVKINQGYSKINRRDQYRSITVTADVEEKEGNAKEIIAEMQKDFLPKTFEKYPHVKILWEGMQKQTEESIAGLIQGLAVAIVAMFVLLTLEFRSYMQPLLVLAIIPFGFIGVIVGHLVLGINLTLFSLFGLVALTGVVINDSIVLVDFINHRFRDGMPIHEALIEAGRRRFRPVILTSTTTIAGLSPLLLETSFQAKFLIPMATSLCFGLLFTTIMVLILVPVLYLGYARIVGERNGNGETLSEASPEKEDAQQGISESEAWKEEHAPDWEDLRTDLRRDEVNP